MRHRKPQTRGRALVTGGAVRLGRAIALGLADARFDVVIAYQRSVGAARATVRDLRRRGARALAVRADLRDAAAARRVVNTAARALGGLDVLVNNAGVRLYHTVEEASAESWDEILGVNLKGYAFSAKAAIPLLRQASSGSIVNVASVRSVTSVGKTTQYDTTKAAVAGLTRGMAADHAADGIRVNAVCPGPIYTPFHEKRIQALGRTFEQYRDDAAKGTLLRRHGTPDEVASCILFLASDDASYVTGTLLFVDGGYTAM